MWRCAIAVLALTDAKCVVNSINLSDHIKKVSLPISAEELETTAFGATYKSRIGGLRDGNVSLDFNQDFASGSVDATLFAALGTVVAVTVKATTAATSATNPEYQFNVLVTETTPFDSSVGELASLSTTWPTTGAITRAVA